MRAEELRIGNLAQDQNENILRVCDLSEDNEGTISFSVVDRSKFPLPDGWKAEPIEYSAETLNILFTNVPEWYRRLIYGGFANFSCASSGYIELEYIHQVQNLYFVLTGGKELTLNKTA